MSTINSNGTVITQLTKKVPKQPKYYQRFKESLVNAYGTRLLIIGIDTALVLLAFVLANLLRFNFNIPDIKLELAPQTLLVVVLVHLAAFKYFKTYSGVMRFTSEQDLLAVLQATMASTALLFIFTLRFDLFGELLFFRKSIVAIDFLISTFFLITYRVALRVLHGLVVAWHRPLVQNS